ncbi:hypothetical protein ACJ72_02577 [Emergomyces africanus]|uniref:Yeast cell wall synthesis Kre9/Knh1-like N-terminal domain-containing protein n=1 Tax=Emergomyces africanus TaxID=1955775 RepID=A0A1B7P218_9EURO|nr:hypothetical protein ACJ72_02577 [Emergomyces africanus]
MHMFRSLLAGALLVAAAVAEDISFTSFPEDVQAGKPLSITWRGGSEDEPVTISLFRGLSTDLKDVKTLTTTGADGTFTWTPESTIVNGDDYALQISQGDDINYTNQFKISGGSAQSASATPSAAPTNSRNSTSTKTTITTGVTVTPTGPKSAPPTALPTTGPAPGSAGSIVAVSSPFALIMGVLAAFAYLH